METTIEQKEKAVEKKVSDAKKRVAKRVKAGLQESVKPETTTDKPKPKPVKKPDSPAQWLESYIKEAEVTTSAAKLATYLLSRESGAKISELIARCSEISDMKGSAWGKSKGSLKSHLRFLQQKGVTVTELGEDHYKVSA